jgi:hypothetical protein
MEQNTGILRNESKSLAHVQLHVAFLQFLHQSIAGVELKQMDK